MVDRGFLVFVQEMGVHVESSNAGIGMRLPAGIDGSSVKWVESSFRDRILCIFGGYVYPR